VLIVTGPEGGLTAQECELLLEAGSRGVRLGNRILRAEPAPVALLAALLLPEAL
jgi:16S rRNA (uracil1498-N3)-methyltransferase